MSERKPSILVAGFVPFAGRPPWVTNGCMFRPEYHLLADNGRTYPQASVFRCWGGYIWCARSVDCSASGSAPTREKAMELCERVLEVYEGASASKGGT